MSLLPTNANILLCINHSVWVQGVQEERGNPIWKLSLSHLCDKSYFSSLFCLISLWWVNWAFSGTRESYSHGGLPVSVSPEPTDAEGEVGGWQEAPWPRSLQRGWLWAGPLKPAPFGYLPCGRCASPLLEWSLCFCVFERVLSPVLTCWSHWRLEKEKRESEWRNHPWFK